MEINKLRKEIKYATGKEKNLIFFLFVNISKLIVYKTFIFLCWTVLKSLFAD